MQKFTTEDGVQQPYKLASQIELWTLLWPKFFIKLSCIFPLLELCMFSLSLHNELMDFYV
jgi:hypothetical protein